MTPVLRRFALNLAVVSTVTFFPAGVRAANGFASLAIKFAADMSGGQQAINRNNPTAATRVGAGVLNTTNWYNWYPVGSSPYRTNLWTYDLNGSTNGNLSSAVIIDFHSGEQDSFNTGLCTNNNVALLNTSFQYGADNQSACAVTNLDPVFATNGYYVYLYYCFSPSDGQQYYITNFAGQTSASAGVGGQVCSLYSTTNWNNFGSGSYATNLPAFLQGTAIFTPGLRTTSTTGHNVYPSWETPGADYIVFSCPPGGAFFISVSNCFYGGIAGLEIVAKPPGGTPAIIGPTITPAARVYAGTTVTLACSTNGGSGTQTVNWQFGADGINFTNLPGATATNLMLASVATNNTGYYQMIYTAGSQSATSAPVQLIIYAGNPLSDYVNTLRGSASTSSFSLGNTAPLTTVPNGFTYWTPVTEAQQNSWIYMFADSAIQGFSASHIPSPWIGDYAHFCVMPEIGTLQTSNTVRQATFSHANETARASYYSVLLDNGIQVEMTPTMHCGVMRFTFPSNSSSHILFNARPTATGSVTVNQSGQVISGNISDPDTAYFQSVPSVYFYATVTKPIAAFGYPANAGVCANVDFATTNHEQVTLSIGTSYLSVAQAHSNLLAEVGANNFNTVQQAAAAAWNNLLGEIEIDGATPDQMTTFYSSLARAYTYPTAMWENVNGTNEYYSPSDGKVHVGKYYTNQGFWDVYKAAWPLYDILTPSLSGDMLNGFVGFSQTFSWLPQWLAPGADGSMGGTESDEIFADAYVKGIRNFNYPGAYQTMVQDSVVDNGGWAATGRTGNGYEPYIGYVPQDIYGSSAGISLEDYQADAAIARMAAALGNTADFQYYANKSLQYSNLFSTSVGGFFRGKSLNGSWRTTDAAFQTNMWGYEFTEGSAWQYRVATAFDGQGLANFFGSRTNLATAIDQVFNCPGNYQVGTYGATIHEMAEMAAENTGQYCENNEPDWYMINMYNNAGVPSKAAKHLRDILGRLYNSGFDPVTGVSNGQGFTGDEDEGGMSSRFVLAACGFFPAAAATAQYLIGSPLYTNIVFHLPNGNSFTICAPNNNTNNIYVQSATLNGVNYTKNYFTHADLLNGGTLVLNLGPAPTAWGTGSNDVPASMTVGTGLPTPAQDCTGAGTITGSAGVGTNLVSLAVDNCDQTAWEVASNTCWFECQLPSPVVVGMYTITCSGTASQNPKSWTLLGSNDGSTWTTLDSRSNQSFTWSYQVCNFSCNNTNAYGYYKLQFTKNNGATTTQIAEIELFNTGRLVLGRLATENFLNACTTGPATNLVITLTNQVSPAPPDGESVTFFDGTNVLGSGTLSTGLATFSSKALAVGTHAVTSVYGGDAGYLASTSSILSLQFNLAAPPSPTIALQPAGGGAVVLNWQSGTLLQATNVTGPWTTNSAANSPYTNSPTQAQMFYRIQQ